MNILLSNFPPCQRTTATCSRMPDNPSLLVLIVPTGFDFGSCPGWSACERHPVYALWRRASQKVSVRPLLARNVTRSPRVMSLTCQFAEMACGNVTVLLNGSVVEAFNRKRYQSPSEADVFDPNLLCFVLAACLEALSWTAWTPAGWTMSTSRW